MQTHSQTTQNSIKYQPSIHHNTKSQIPDAMPRGGEYDDGPTVASDNAITSGENKIAGAPKGDSDVSHSPSTPPTAFHYPLTLTSRSLFQEPVSSGVDRSGKAAPPPEGISEMKDAPGSGGGSQGVIPGGGEKTTGGGSGKGGN